MIKISRDDLSINSLTSINKFKQYLFIHELIAFYTIILEHNNSQRGSQKVKWTQSDDPGTPDIMKGFMELWFIW